MNLLKFIDNYFKNNKEVEMQGKRRGGKPRTEAERKARHKRIYGTSKTPKRGSVRK